MKLKQNGKTINSYFIFIILLLLVIFGLNLLNNRTDEYTKAEFIADLDAGNVSEVVVQPNGEAPTGYLEIQMKNGVSHKLYATDITELETLVPDLYAADAGRAGGGNFPVHDDECPTGRRR